MFPTQTVTVTSRDPAPITPEIKAMLRRKNRLMRDGRAEKAGVIAARIGKKITAQSRLQLRGINARTDAKALWAAVRKLTNAGKSDIVVDGITAQSQMTTRLRRRIATTSSRNAAIFVNHVVDNPWSLSCF